MLKIQKLLKGETGESLVESLISITILSLLIATVTLTIATGLRITDNATQDAEEAQTRVNEIIQGDFIELSDPADPDEPPTVATDTVRFYLEFEAIVPTGTFSGTFSGIHEVQINDELNQQAFRPSP